MNSHILFYSLTVLMMIAPSRIDVDDFRRVLLTSCVGFSEVYLYKGEEIDSLCTFLSAPFFLQCSAFLDSVMREVRVEAFGHHSEPQKLNLCNKHNILSIL